MRFIGPTECRIEARTMREDPRERRFGDRGNACRWHRPDREDLLPWSRRVSPRSQSDWISIAFFDRRPRCGRAADHLADSSRLLRALNSNRLGTMQVSARLEIEQVQGCLDGIHERSHCARAPRGGRHEFELPDLRVRLVERRLGRSSSRRWFPDVTQHFNPVYSDAGRISVNALRRQEYPNLAGNARGTDWKANVARQPDHQGNTPLPMA